MAGAGDEGCVSVVRGTGSSLPFLGGGGRGHGTAVASVVGLGGAGAAVAGAGGGRCVSVAWRAGSAVPFFGGGEADMGRQWRAWWRLGEQERRERGPAESWWRLGEQKRCK